MKLFHVAIIIVIVFILTYDPNSGTLNHLFTDSPLPQKKTDGAILGP